MFPLYVAGAPSRPLSGELVAQIPASAAREIAAATSAEKMCPALSTAVPKSRMLRSSRTRRIHRFESPGAVRLARLRLLSATVNLNNRLVNSILLAWPRGRGA
ncbi:MAG: hypothetical protein ACLPSW_30720, partial [Roseiarcus sp.]